MKTFLYKTTILAALLALAASCAKPEQPEEVAEHHEEENAVELTKAQMQTAGIELGKMEEKQISGTIKANGVLDVPPQQLVSVSVPLGGFLKSTSLLQGSRVKKGQLIAVIENADYIQLQQDYLEARNQLELAQADYERQEQLAKESVNAVKTLQQSKSTYQTWQVKRNALQAKLKLLNMDMRALDAGTITSTCNLYALIDGYVTQVNVNIGKFVNPSDVLFEIVDTEHLHAELTVFEKDVPRVKIGQRVRFTLANEREQRLATVYLIGREIGQDRSVRIHCHIDKEDTELLPGMYLKAAVETGGTLVPAVPDDAIIDFQGEKYVFVPASSKEKDSTEEQHFSMIPVKTGNSELGYTEIIPDDTLTTDMQIVVKGAYAILSKIKNSEEE